jgi:NADH pyrophosphatase NudC (nudix superfamily)
VERLVCAACGRVEYENPAPCVSVLVADRGRVLLGLRGPKSLFPGKWCLPCGYVENGEAFYDAAAREVREETGIEVEVLGVVNVVTNLFPGRKSSLVVTMLARPLSEVPVAGDDVAEARWFDLAGELPPMAFQADVHIIGKYRRTRCAGALDVHHSFFDERTGGK